jgi:hypothetical protein
VTEAVLEEVKQWQGRPLEEPSDLESHHIYVCYTDSGVPKVRRGLAKASLAPYCELSHLMSVRRL